ncbi:5572_t:CDS:10 [Ambispora leptoticha]|uniref:Conserved oligomeric Golgi complex subunit 3 n=1 Tax=Ambispora leptoticha TaxID=144679 RepID=A0A9N8W402_9GLOM|nr:5572_t:CDS:10 [Ambispora leptoticha]
MLNAKIPTLMFCNSNIVLLMLQILRSDAFLSVDRQDTKISNEIHRYKLMEKPITQKEYIQEGEKSASGNDFLVLFMTAENCNIKLPKQSGIVDGKVFMTILDHLLEERAVYRIGKKRANTVILARPFEDITEANECDSQSHKFDPMSTVRNKGITLEEWESKTQLTELQKQSVLEIQDACLELPLPEGYLNDIGGGTGTPQLISPSPGLKENYRTSSPYPRLTPSPLPRSRSTTNLLAELAAETAVASSTDASSLGIPQPIETTQQFFDWFAKMETDMEKDQEDVYRNFLAIITVYRQACDNFLSQIDSTVKLFHDLDGNFRFVEERTKALQTACEKLLEEQNHLEALADAMSSKLAYYNEFEAINSLFSSLGENICEKKEFLPTLNKLDECLEYMQGNLRYRDSELYLMRFRQCMTRGMNLIKMSFVGDIKGLGIEIAKKANQPLDLESQQELSYSKFRALAPKLKPLLNEIEKRCPAYGEYSSLLSDCYNAYFSVRQQLLIPAIVAQIQSMGSGGSDILAFTRNGYSSMKNLCSDEYSLFYEFFSTGEDDLYGNLDLLCSYLYDELRPLIIHEAHIDTLSELCKILQDHAIHDKQLAEKGKSGLRFSFLIRNVLQDAQQRLVFRAQTYIESNIKKFVPQPNDLDYPNKLKASSEIVVGEETSNIESEQHTLTTTDITDQMSPHHHSLTKLKRQRIIADVSPHCNGLCGFFQNFIHALMCDSIFDDIAQEVVQLCLESLLTASENITKKNKLDGQLFLIKHLLILKEQIATFKTQFIHEEKDLDFSEITDAINEILQNKYSILRPNTLFGLAQKGMPKVVESRVDSKLEVDKRLKSVCEEFILDNAKEAVEPLSSFLLKASFNKNSNDIRMVSAFRMRNDLKPAHQQTPLKNQRFAQLINIIQVYEEFQSSVKSRLRFITSKLSQYLNDAKTENVLLKPMQNHIIESYQAFYDIIELEFDMDKLQSSLNSVENVKIWVEDSDSWQDEREENEDVVGDLAISATIDTLARPTSRTAAFSTTGSSRTVPDFVFTMIVAFAGRPWTTVSINHNFNSKHELDRNKNKDKKENSSHDAR